MKAIHNKRIPTSYLDLHHFVADILRAEYSILSLYTDGRRNWLYLWADINETDDRHRFLVFRASRPTLIDYLQKKRTLRDLLRGTDAIFVLDQQELEEESPKKGRRLDTRRLWQVQPVDVQEYWPADDSYFDKTLAPDLDLTKELVPERYPVPIKGEWFSRDFEYLFKRYERLYAFFYATRPRFVRTMSTTLYQQLRAPWKGGYSRVNLYARLAERLPALHALRVDRLRYASPGEVEFEAIPKIGESIQNATTSFLDNEDTINELTKKIHRILTSERLNKSDLSVVPDGAIRIETNQLRTLLDSCQEIAQVLKVRNELESLQNLSPNTIVYAKAVASFVRQLSMLARLQRDGMLNFK
jgi:hypothetical protein